MSSPAPRPRPSSNGFMHRIQTTQCSIDKVEQCLESQLEEFICKDDRANFVNLLRSQTSKAIGSDLTAWVLPIRGLWESICYHSAFSCAKALLEGETGWHVDVNVALADGLTPLQYAAMNLSYDNLVVLLSEHGARTSECDVARLPLSLALEALSCDPYVREWSLTKSIYKLFYIFSLPELYEPLETVQALASRTCLKEIEKICLLYVEQENFVSLAALLMLVWDTMMVEGVDNSLLNKHILRELGSEPGEGRKHFLKLALKMLGILDKGHSFIKCYHLDAEQRVLRNYEMPLRIAFTLSEHARCELKPEDVWSNDIPCLTRTLKPKEKADLYAAIQQKINSEATYSPPARMEMKPSSCYPSLGYQNFAALNGNNHPVKGQLSQTIHGVKPRNLHTAKICARGILMAKKTFRL